MRLALFCLFASAARAFAPPLLQVATPPASTRLASSSSSSASAVEDGWVKTVTESGSGKPLNLGDIATVKYCCYLPDDNTQQQDESSSTTLPFARSSRQKVVVGDNSMITGWDKALRTMSIGERSTIRINDPTLAYGSAGVPPLVPPNAVVEVDLTVLDSQPATTNIDFDSLATADTTPRTASDIQAAFEARQASKSGQVELEGLDFWIDKAKNFYFFGLFEGETGEQAPWFLRPSITFPLAFLIVGAAFYVTFLGGAIYERGAPVTDELDEFITSTSTVLSNPATLLAMLLTGGSGLGL